MKKQLLATSFALSLMTVPFGFGASVDASTVTEMEASVGVLPGVLNLVSSSAGPIDLGTFNLSDEKIRATANLGSFTVYDYTGTGEGWKFSVSANRLSSGSLKLPANSLFIDTTGFTHNSSNGQGSVTLTTGNVFIDDGSSHILAEATPSNGFGSHILSFKNDSLVFELDLSKVESGKLVDNVNGNTYETTITFTITKGI